MAVYNFKDETGNRYGRLTVIERAPNSSDGRAMWKCKCDCGNETIVLGKKLRNGTTQSCRCYKHDRIVESNMARTANIIGKRFGKLVVIKESSFITHTSGRRSRTYECHCDCGNVCTIQHQYLTYGDTQSCGCLRSKGEMQIALFLKEKGIKFKREFSFEDLIDKQPLRFDFALFDNNDNLKCLIEFQGTQHYNPNNGYYNESVILHDKMKKDYCNKNNIKLIEIKYKRDYDLKLEDLHLEEFYEL